MRLWEYKVQQGPSLEFPASTAYNGTVVYNGSPAISPNGDPVLLF